MKGRRKVKSVTLACVQALKQVPTHTLSDNHPTPERLMKAGVSVAMQLGTRKVQVIGRGMDMPIGFDGVMRLNQAPLDRLFARGKLADGNEDANRQRYEAGERLRSHHYLAGLSGIAANDLNGSGGGHPASRTPITETMERARRAMRLGESSMDPGDWRTLVHVVCEEASLEAAGNAAGYHERHAAHAVALDRVRRGLSALAELWGYSPPPRPESGPPPAANDAVSSAYAA